MGKWKKRSRWGAPDGQAEPWMARIPILLLLLNVFVWAGLRGTDILVITLLSSLLGLVGLLMSRHARHAIRRKGGRIRGESMATIGYWCNLGIFVFASLLFAYALAIGVMRGELL